MLQLLTIHLEVMRLLDKLLISTSFIIMTLFILTSCQESEDKSKNTFITRKLNYFNDDKSLSSGKWEVCDGLEVKTKNKTIHHILKIELPPGTTDKTIISFIERIFINDSMANTFMQEIYIDSATIFYSMNSLESFEIGKEIGFLFYCSSGVYPYGMEEFYTLIQWSYFNGTVSRISGSIPLENEHWNTVYSVNKNGLSGNNMLDNILTSNWDYKIKLLRDA